MGRCTLEEWVSGCCQGFVNSYSGVGAIDAAQGKMGIDAKREKKKDILT